MSGRAVVLMPGEGRVLDMGAFRMTVKVVGAQNGDAFSLLEADEPSNFGPPLHVHEDAAERVLRTPPANMSSSSVMRTTRAQRAHLCSSRRVFEHGFRVADRPSKKLNLYLPAAMIGHFDELAAANSPERCLTRSR